MFLVKVRLREEGTSLNTAAACLKIVAQQLHSPAELTWIQRQLRGQRLKHLVEAAEKTARDRWEGLFARFIRTGFKASTTSNISSNIGDFLTNFSSLLILWFGATLVIDHKLTIGQLG